MKIEDMNQAQLLDFLENLRAPNDGSLPSDLSYR